MDICIINNPSSLGAGKLGSFLGFEALKLRAFETKNDFFLKTKIINIDEVTKKQEEAINSNTYKHAKYIDTITDIQYLISNVVFDTKSSGYFPIIISGDHSNSIGSIAGIKKYYGNTDVGILWFDAHADMHSPYTSPTGNIHGMSLAALAHEDNKMLTRNQLTAEEITLWDKLKSIINKEQKINFNDIVYAGLRSAEMEERELIKNSNIQVSLVNEIRSNGVEFVANRILNHFKNHEKIHISFDVDALDTSVSEGTGTPVDDGYFLKETIELFSILLDSGKVCSMDIVEIDPTLDTKNSMAKNILHLFEKLYAR